MTNVKIQLVYKDDHSRIYRLIDTNDDYLGIVKLDFHHIRISMKGEFSSEYPITKELHPILAKDFNLKLAPDKEIEEYLKELRGV